MKVNISGRIAIELSENDAQLAKEIYGDMSFREAVIRYSRDEAKEYIHDRGYLEFNGFREKNGEMVVEFLIKDTQKTYHYHAKRSLKGYR